MVRKISVLAAVIPLLLVTGCMVHYPTEMYPFEIFEVFMNKQRVHPKGTIYKRYSDGKHIMHFDRIGRTNAIYGWIVCHECTWKRKRVAAIYDGSQLYVVYGAHENLFNIEILPFEPLNKDGNWKTNWFWNVINIYKIEGQSLMHHSQYRKCIWGDAPTVREWTNAPLAKGGDKLDCKKQQPGRYEKFFIAVDDATLQ